MHKKYRTAGPVKIKVAPTTQDDRVFKGSILQVLEIPWKLLQGSFWGLLGPSSTFGRLCLSQLLRCPGNLTGTEGTVTAMAARQGMHTATVD